MERPSLSASCYVVSPWEIHFFLKGNGRRVDLGERGDVRVVGRSGGRGDCSQDLSYERKIK